MSSTTSVQTGNILPAGLRADALLDQKVQELWSFALATTTISVYETSEVARVKLV